MGRRDGNVHCDPLKLQAFVFNWKGHEANALALERAIGRWTDVTVINSDAGLSGPRADWVHLGESAYFSAQWNKALELFEGDVLFHIQADARFDDFERLFARATSLLGRGDIGIYEPGVDFTAFRYDTSRLRAIETQLFEVPFTDTTCWFVGADLLGELPPVDLSANRYGWGIAPAVAAVCHLKGKLCVRDYRFRVMHPRGRGYPSQIADRERDAYLSSLGPEIAREAARLYEWRARVRPAPIGARRGLRRPLRFRRKLS